MFCWEEEEDVGEYGVTERAHPTLDSLGSLMGMLIDSRKQKTRFYRAKETMEVSF